MFFIYFIKITRSPFQAAVFNNVSVESDSGTTVHFYNRILDDFIKRVLLYIIYKLQVCSFSTFLEKKNWLWKKKMWELLYAGERNITTVQLMKGWLKSKKSKCSFKHISLNPNNWLFFFIYLSIYIYFLLFYLFIFDLYLISFEYYF